MKSDICIFGANSILAQNFINFRYRENNLIGIFRNNFVNNKLVNSIHLNLGKKISVGQIRDLANSLNIRSPGSNLTFILFSWSGNPRSSISDKKRKIWITNELIIRNFIDICSYVIPNKIIFISSAGSIYDQKSLISAKESHKPNPSSPYGEQKLISENLLTTFSKSMSIDLTILRISSAYGFNSNVPDQGVLNKWLYAAKNGSQIVLYNSFDSLINFVSFNQISQSIDICIKRNITGCFNIGCERSTSLKELYLLVCKITKNINLELQMKSNEKRFFILDTKLFQSKSNVVFKDNLFLEGIDIYKSFNDM